MRNTLKLFATALLCGLISNGSLADQNVRTLSNTVSLTPTITAGAYSDGDIIGGQLVFTGASASPRKSGVILSASIVDEADQGANIVVTCMNSSFTVAADNAANALSDDDARKISAQFLIATADYVDHGGVKIGRKSGINQVIRTDNSNKLYCQMHLLGSTPTYSATNDLTLKLDILQD